MSRRLRVWNSRVSTDLNLSLWHAFSSRYTINESLAYAMDYISVSTSSASKYSYCIIFFVHLLLILVCHSSRRRVANGQHPVERKTRRFGAWLLNERTSTFVLITVCQRSIIIETERELAEARSLPRQEDVKSSSWEAGPKGMETEKDGWHGNFDIVYISIWFDLCVQLI